MCEYCGCQSIDAIRLLTLEHEQALDHAQDARTALRAGDGDELRKACRRLTDVLAPHTAVEELGLFPPMLDAFPEQIELLHREHETIDRALAEAVTSVPAGDGWQTRLAEALDLLARHILKEQDGVFPAALMTLSPQEWDRLDSLRTTEGLTSSTTPTDGGAP